MPAGKFCRFFMIHGKLHLTSFIMEKTLKTAATADPATAAKATAILLAGPQATAAATGVFR